MCLDVLPQTRQQLAEPSEHAVSHLVTKCFCPAELRQRQLQTHAASGQSLNIFVFCTVKLRIILVASIHLLMVCLLIILPHIVFFRGASEMYAPAWSLPSLHLSQLKGMNRDFFTHEPKTKIWSPETDAAFKDLVHVLPAAGWSIPRCYSWTAVQIISL